MLDSHLVWPFICINFQVGTVLIMHWHKLASHLVWLTLFIPMHLCSPLRGISVTGLDIAPSTVYNSTGHEHVARAWWRVLPRFLLGLVPRQINHRILPRVIDKRIQRDYLSFGTIPDCRSWTGIPRLSMVPGCVTSVSSGLLVVQLLTPRGCQGTDDLLDAGTTGIAIADCIKHVAVGAPF